MAEAMPDEICPKCGGELFQSDKNTFTGEVWREYTCRSCEHVVDLKEGAALWQALHDDAENAKKSPPADSANVTGSVQGASATPSGGALKTAHWIRDSKVGLMVGPAFVLAGLYFLVFHFGRDMRLWLATRTGIETPVIDVMEVKYITISSDDEGGVTHNVQVRYSYQANGSIYTGTLASVHQEADNFGSFHRHLYDRIMAFKSGKGPLTCFVSRADPSLAVLDNTLRPSRIAVYLLFILSFTGIGVLATWFGLKA